MAWLGSHLHTRFTIFMVVLFIVVRAITIDAIMNAMELVALPILWAMLIYGCFDKLLARYAKYKPALPVKEPTYIPSDFSILVATKGSPAVFLRCLRIWVKNKPKEIIISTVEEEVETIKNAIDSDKTLAGLRAVDYIKVVWGTKAGKRLQVIEGLKHASGRIIAMSDDHITWSETLLEGIAPCFEDPKVGACSVPIGVDIPEDRCDPAIITGWEVVSARMLQKRNMGLKITYALGKWCWIVAGPLMVYRAKIVQDPKFIEAYANDRWGSSGPIMDVGEDGFISRWAQKKKWTIAVQDIPGTTILRTTRRDHTAITQGVRWERSSIQHFLRTLLGIRQFWRNPYVAWKTIERVTRPAWTTVHILAWMVAARKHPQTTLAFVAFYIYDQLPSYWAFFEEYPYMKGHWFAVLAADYCYIIQDWWGWFTLSDTTWEGRKLEKLESVQGAEKEEEDSKVENVEPDQGAGEKEANEVGA